MFVKTPRQERSARGSRKHTRDRKVWGPAFEVDGSGGKKIWSPRAKLFSCLFGGWGAGGQVGSGGLLRGMGLNDGTNSFLLPLLLVTEAQ